MLHLKGEKLKDSSGKMTTVLLNPNTNYNLEVNAYVEFDGITENGLPTNTSYQTSNGRLFTFISQHAKQIQCNNFLVNKL